MWFYTLGAPEGQHWFDDCDVFPRAIQNLTDGEAARAPVTSWPSSRATTRRRSSSTRMTGAPPAQPTRGALQPERPNGQVRRPVVVQRRPACCAFQDGDGVTTLALDLATCAWTSPRHAHTHPRRFRARLLAAAINPGLARPPCGNPGNPAACQQVGRCRQASLANALRALLAREAEALGKLKDPRPRAPR